MTDIPMPLRLLIISILLIGCITGGVWYFLNHGYAYNFQPLDDRPAASYQYSQKCTDLQEQKKQAEAPLLAEMEPIAEKLVYGQLPIENGQALYDQYDSLRKQVTAIDAKYVCS